MMKMEMETDQKCAEQRVKQLKHVKQRTNQQHYSHVHHKSKELLIAVILKLTHVAWDSWTYQISY